MSRRLGDRSLAGSPMSPDPSPRSETAPIVATVADVPPVARRYRPSPLALCALAVAGVVVVVGLASGGDIRRRPLRTIVALFAEPTPEEDIRDTAPAAVPGDRPHGEPLLRTPRAAAPPEPSVEKSVAPPQFLSKPQATARPSEVPLPALRPQERRHFPTSRQSRPPSSSLPPSSKLPRRPQPPPQPPQPYNYETFVPWFKAQSWRDFGLPVTPSLNWFDIDAALGGKFQCHLEERDLHSVVGVAKAINRFAFMRGIMESGDDSVQASLEMHLLTLTFLQQRLASPGGISALDIGCGTGWLLEAFALASNNSNSRISGFDLDVEAASRALSDPDAASAATETPPPKVFQANVLQERFGLDADTQRQLLPAGSFDIVNVGVAIRSVDSPLFAKVFDLLSIGGVLTAPVCDRDVEPGARTCRARFRKFQRDVRNTPLPLASAGGISFVLPV